MGIYVYVVCDKCEAAGQIGKLGGETGTIIQMGWHSSERMIFECLMKDHKLQLVTDATFSRADDDYIDASEKYPEPFVWKR